MDLKNKITELCGSLSMCWNPRPAGVFDSTQALKYSNEICELVEADLAQLKSENEKLKAKIATAREEGARLFLEWHRGPDPVVSDAILENTIEQFKIWLKAREGKDGK